MKSHLAMTLGLVVGFGLGAVAIGNLHAQGKPQAYAVVNIAEVGDPEGFKALFPFAEAALKETGGRYLIRTEKVTAFDGTPPKRFVVIAFDSVEKAQAWHNSENTKKVDDIRAKTTKSNSFLVEGM
jgi:uncharacterized protein (DUF1330 family)